MAHTSDHLRHEIRNYNILRRSTELGLQFRLKKIRIHLFGLTGHGKSALINTFLCVFHNSEYQIVANEEHPERGTGGGTTVDLQYYQLLRTCVDIVDNRGCTRFSFGEQTEYRRQMEGERQLLSDVEFMDDWKANLLSPFLWFEQLWNESKDQSALVVPILVMSKTYPWGTEMLGRVHQFCSVVCRYTGVYPIIVATFGQENDGNHETELFPDLPGAKFLVNNYNVTSMERNQKTDEDILRILKLSLDYADRILVNCRNFRKKPRVFN
ncbi:uncharacterized protein LOC122798642 [Protopterus annectens]|uniref:uncharacterized protein LOC122798642 n=1 Tax=Protopterus annectens TaxID=7888 RepID=UPI001CFAE4A9|nr:uncharacterized protein LOC122798642 [Protopterus annectens]